MDKRIPFALIAAAALAACQGAEPLYESGPCDFILDTHGSPRTVKSLDALWPLTYRAGETVLAVSPAGATNSVVASPAANAGTVGWTPSEGGLWTLLNSVSGEAVFAVHYSIFGNSGSGTEAAPYLVSDAEDFEETLAAQSATNGLYFAFADSVFSTISRPAGFTFLKSGSGVWQLVASDDGLAFLSEPAAFGIDTAALGPSRAVSWRDGFLPIAYSGDSWRAFSASAPSTLTLVSPLGNGTTVELTGTGGYAFRPKVSGMWLLTLVAGDGTSLSGRVEIRPAGHSVYFK